MLHDWGSRDRDFIAINHAVCERLVDISGARGTHVCVPVQGSGTFAIEATIGTLTAQDSRLLVLVNGAYGRRVTQICDYYQRQYEVLETEEHVPNDTEALDRALGADPKLSHVVVIHCETTSGILNPVNDIASITARHRRSLIIDAMSAFGAIELDARDTPFDAVVASSNKCFEGAPGMGFAIIREDVLAASQGHTPSLSLDLYAQ